METEEIYIYSKNKLSIEDILLISEKGSFSYILNEDDLKSVLLTIKDRIESNSVPEYLIGRISLENNILKIDGHVKATFTTKENLPFVDGAIGGSSLGEFHSIFNQEYDPSCLIKECKIIEEELNYKKTWKEINHREERLRSQAKLYINLSPLKNKFHSRIRQTYKK